MIKMIHTAIKSILGMTLLGLTANACADIIYQSDDRYIQHGVGGTFTPTTPYAAFVDDWWAYEAGAFQNSNMSATGMSGSGWTYAGFDAMNYGADAKSVFSTRFAVDELTNFSLSGSLDTGFWGGYMSVSLVKNGAEIFSFNTWDLLNNGISPFSLNGQFVVGNNYQLTLSSYADDTNYYNEKWDFKLNTVSAVPVPAAVWLFGSGLLTLAGLSRRKKYI